MERIALYFLDGLARVLIGPSMQTCGQQQRTDRAKPAVRYTVTELGTLGGTFSQAFGVNDKGWLVGFSTTSGGLRAFLWSDRVVTDLGTQCGRLSKLIRQVRPIGCQPATKDLL